MDSLSSANTPRMTYDSDRPLLKMCIPENIKKSDKYQKRVSIYKCVEYKISLSNLHAQILAPNDIILLNDGTAAFCMEKIYQYGNTITSIFACYKNSKCFMVYPYEISGIVQKQDTDYNTLLQIM